jgi:signal transduction histidine kinase
MIKNNIIFTCDYKFDGNIEIYKNELIQVLLILLNNSIYQMSLNSNNKNILIAKTEVVESDIRLIITDNGGGIEDNIIKNIFDRYFTTKDEDQGTGLGLSIAYDIIKNKLNGTISAKNINFYAENENFKGACFEIVLRDYLND